MEPVAVMRNLGLSLALLFAVTGSAGAQDVAHGEEIFNSKCQSCHRLTDAMKNGPGLAGVTKRRTDEWLHKWLANPKAVIESGDPDAQAMLKKYKSKMPAIDLMQDEKNRNDVIAFLKAQDAKQ